MFASWPNAIVIPQALFDHGDCYRQLADNPLDKIRAFTVLVWISKMAPEAQNSVYRFHREWPPDMV
jgi:hypothetical protein